MKWLLYSVCGLFLCVQTFAAKEFRLNSYKIFADKDAYEEPGSVYKVGKKLLKEKQQTNAHEILKEVPGVSLQKEDGFGLRLNIGLRGTHPHRSKKITLLEDGVMIAPAPYSAPAAYYSPLFSRITEVEVYKGPSSLKYGPNSIGGAINFVTRDFQKKAAEIDYSIGSFNTHKYQAWASQSHKNLSWLIEANRLESDGFKELPGTDLSFFKNDFLIKARYDFDSKLQRSLDFKWSWAEEESNETYLGLTREDFNSTPNRRYQASAEDLLDWTHSSYQIKFFNEWSTNAFSELSVYRNDFDRTWDKLNGFLGVDTQDVLKNPVGQNADFLSVLKGEKDSTPSETLQAGINARTYYSQGLQLATEVNFTRDLTLENAFLYHEDQIERTHLLQNKAMVNGELTDLTGEFTDPSNQNRDSAQVFRHYYILKHKSQRALNKIGFRAEHIKFSRRNNFDGTLTKKSETSFVPGAGSSYKVHNNLLVFLGAHKGLTLPGPGQATNISPEESWNFELGLRTKGRFQLELVGFYSDYENILGTCTFSVGCTTTDLDIQFNGGEARVYGLEFLASTKLRHKAISFPLRSSITYTSAEFRSERQSNNKEWGVGLIRVGDPLPYIPEVNLNLSLGLTYKKFQALMDFNYQSKVFDQAVREGRFTVPSFTTLNFNTSYRANKKLKVYAQVNNLMDEVYLSTLRPFGYRPGAPRWFSLGVNYKM